MNTKTPTEEAGKDTRGGKVIEFPSQFSPQQEPCDRILRISEVLKTVSVSRSTLCRWERLGQFPTRVQLTNIGSNSATGWRLSDLNNWMRTRKQCQER